jgi:hypothetical protein
MSDPLNIASDTNYSSGSESGQTTKYDPGAAAVAQGFLPDEKVEASFLNWVLGGLAAAIAAVVTSVATIAGYFTASKLNNANLALLDGGNVTPAALLKFVFPTGVTNWITPEAGASMAGTLNVKWRVNALTTTDATAAQVIDTYTPPDGSTIWFDAWVVAKGVTTAADTAAYHIRHAAMRNGGTTTLIGSVNLLAQEIDTNWASSSSVSTPAVRITVTGEAASTIKWVVIWRIVEWTPAP